LKQGEGRAYISPWRTKIRKRTEEVSLHGTIHIRKGLERELDWRHSRKHFVTPEGEADSYKNVTVSSPPQRAGAKLLPLGSTSWSSSSARGERKPVCCVVSIARVSRGSLRPSELIRGVRAGSACSDQPRHWHPRGAVLWCASCKPQPPKSQSLRPCR
jgi:hypothetical protein